MATLHELAIKLQESIIQQQGDAHNASNLNVHKYNNMKLQMKSEITYPHVVISIGISEAVYNIKDCTKVEGGLGSDEKYIRKWLGKSSVLESLMEVYDQINELGQAENMRAEDLAELAEGKAGGVRLTKYDAEQPKNLSNLKRLEENVKETKQETNKISINASSVSPDKIKKTASGEEEEETSEFATESYEEIPYEEIDPYENNPFDD